MTWRTGVVFVLFLLTVGMWLVTHPGDDAAPYSHVAPPVARPAPTVLLPPSGGSRSTP